MVSGTAIIVVALILVSVSVSYVILLLTTHESGIKEKPTFIDFYLKQEGSNILVQNIGTKIIPEGSLKIYFGNTLLQITNKNEIPPNSTYIIKLSELPSFEGRINIAVELGNINKSLELAFPKPPSTEPELSLKIYKLSIGIVGRGNTTPGIGVYEYQEGSEVKVDATPDRNYTFSHYLLDGVKVFSNPIIIKMDKNHSLEVVFLRSDISQFNFDVALNTSSVSIYRGDKVSVLVFINLTNGTTQTVTLLATDNSTGTNLLFTSQNGTPPFTSLLTILTEANAQLGTHKITVLATNGTITKSAELLVSIEPCIRRNPTVLISLSNPFEYMGMNYSIAIKNNDDYNCGAELFSLSVSCPSVFSCSLKDSMLTINSGNMINTSMILNPVDPNSVTAGDYTFFVNVTNNANNNYKSYNSSTYKILDNLVYPIIFFTKNYTVDNTLVGFFREKIFEIRKFYFNNNNNKTFQALPLSVVAGNEFNEFYWCNGATNCAVANQFEANIITELRNKGYPVHQDWNQFPSNRIVWVLAIGGGGYAGARQYPTGGGFAMVGDAAIYATLDNDCARVKDRYFLVDNPPNAKDSCMNTWLPSGKIYGFGVGALAHELGHAFGLPHPDSYGYSSGSIQWAQTLLGEHWNYPNTGLLDEDRNILATSKFFT
ncbi:MAG: hypothetical protein QXD72_01120 [Candidatus Aenigmatarchaeota archaeon]